MGFIGKSFIDKNEVVWNSESMRNIVIAVVVLLVLGGVLFFISRPKDPPLGMLMPSSIKIEESSSSSKVSDMKIYINTKYGFSIMYPSSWTYTEYPDTKDGASFFPAGQEGNYEKQIASIGVMGKVLTDTTTSFDEYVKKAASIEIQGYQKQYSSKKITTQSGIVGYETTWLVSPPPRMGTTEENPPKPADFTSQPITYFPMPKGDAKNTIQVNLQDKNYLTDYEKMLPTFSYITAQ